MTEFKKIALEIANLLEYKNEQYGNSALSPIEIFSGKSKVGQRIEKVLNIKHKENSYTEFIETILKDYYQRFKDD